MPAATTEARLLPPSALRRRGRAYFEAAALLERAAADGTLRGRLSKRMSPVDQDGVVEIIRDDVVAELRAKASLLRGGKL